VKKDREGKKENGKFYLRVGKTWVEVNEEVYYGYMDLVWQEEKNADRRSRCMIGGKRCECNCDECKHERTGSPLSLDQMYEENEYEAPDKNPSVEDHVLAKLLKEALHRELDALPIEDQVLLHDIYFEDVPYTQRQIARKLHISQQAVSKRHLSLLADLRVKLEAEICG
jgi:RNA polymerase sigma factor (sigma-70 family)